MENKLYYQNPYISTFKTKLKYQQKDEINGWYAVLEQTAFYPTGGGQPFDKGLLHSNTVVNVEEVNGEIRHYLTSPLPENVSIIEGQIDWTRRFDHMQQHAGQHILSAAFEELYSYSTVSFHLGQEFLTIDLAIDNIKEDELKEAEKLANQVILENRPIQTKWVSCDEIGEYPLRKELSVTENIRLVIIPDFDYNGCGGTHPSSTGQVGSIKILGWERQKQKIRLQFVCGDRVLKQLHTKQQIVSELTRLLNSPESEIITSLNKLLDNGKRQEKLLEETQQLLLQAEANELMGYSVSFEEHFLICKVTQWRSLKELQVIVRKLTSSNDNVIVFLVSESSGQLQFIAGRGSKVKVSMKNIISNLLSTINGKGGGNDALAQGGGATDFTGMELIEAFKESLKQELIL